MAILVFADDWGRHPSSCQHLIRQLLARHRVGWVNTIGTRPPRLDRATVGRAVEKIAHWTVPRPSGGSLPPNLEVLQPWMWPWMRRRIDRRLNRWLLHRQLLPWMEHHRPEVAVTTLPIVADVMDDLPVEQWVYYCVDDFSKWPGLDHGPLEAMEREVIDKADILVAAGQQLQQRLAGYRSDVALMTHGVDLDHWRDGGAGGLPEGLVDFPRPLSVFWGLVDRRLDVEMVRAVARAVPQGTICLVGPEQDPDPQLSAIRGVRRIPAVAYDHLPAIASAADVLIMPYADLPVTRAMQPLKLLEYLATGKPVVARDLPAVTPWSDGLDAVGDPQEFAARVAQRIASGLPPGQRAARDRLCDESWQAKADWFEQYALFPSPTRSYACG